MPRGPRALKGTKAYQIGHLSLLRFRHGRERQVSQRTLDAVRGALGAGVEPWNTAEHVKAVHNPAPEGGTTNSMESEPPESETCDDEGDDETRAPRRTNAGLKYACFFKMNSRATGRGTDRAQTPGYKHGEARSYRPACWLRRY